MSELSGELRPDLVGKTGRRNHRQSDSATDRRACRRRRPPGSRPGRDWRCPVRRDDFVHRFGSSVNLRRTVTGFALQRLGRGPHRHRPAGAHGARFGSSVNRHVRLTQRRGQAEHWMYPTGQNAGSVNVTCVLIASGPSTLVVRPLGHVTSMRSIASTSPRPK